MTNEVIKELEKISLIIRKFNLSLFDLTSKTICSSGSCMLTISLESIALFLRDSMKHDIPIKKVIAQSGVDLIALERDLNKKLDLLHSGEFLDDLQFLKAKKIHLNIKNFLEN